MRFLKKIIPGFLQDLDHQLMVRFPWFWTLRLPYHLWMLLLLNVLLFVVSFIWPINFDRIPEVEFIFGLFFILQVAYFCFWVYRIVLFNRDKNFGQWEPFQSVIQFVVWWFSLALILSLSFTPAMILSYRIDQSISHTDFAADINRLGLGEPYAEEFTDEYEYYYSEQDFRDRMQDEISDRNVRHYRSKYNNDERPSLSYRIRRAREKIEDFEIWIDGERDTITFQDSIRFYRNRMNWLKAKYPKYYSDFNAYDVDSALFPGALQDQELFEDYLATIHQPDTVADRKLRARIRTAKKYGRFYRHDEDVYVNYYHYYRDKYVLKIRPNARHKFPPPAYTRDSDERINYRDNLKWIEEAKLKKHFFLDFEFGMFAFLFSYCLALLVFLFTSFRWQNFLAAIATGIVLSVFMAVSLEWIVGRDENIILSELLLLFLLFVAIIAFFSLKKAHSHIASTLMILVVAALPFFPLLVMKNADVHYDVFDRDRYELPQEKLMQEYQDDRISEEEYMIKKERYRKLNRELRERIAGYYMVVYFAGVGLFILFGVPVVKRKANRMLALPKKK